ncbi:MAG TPA: hypothetical protein VFA13_02795 [Candidatus Acidoferrum sp.]|jgi:hypothetical protein|nr:hypothetical protein [Candidatus Acidoferrum sp.]
MADKPTRASDYPPEQLERVRATCLYVATKLGDLMDDVVVIGGFVPSLLIPQDNLAEGVAPHVGTMDLDLGLKFAVIDERRYQEISERLQATTTTTTTSSSAPAPPPPPLLLSLRLQPLASSWQRAGNNS